MNQVPIVRSARRMAPRALTLILAVLLEGACAKMVQKEARPPEGPQARAEQLLAALRRADWGAAARFVYLDANTRARMGIASGVSTEEAVPQIEVWFRTIYASVPVGPVHSVTIDPSDPTRAKVSYRAGDLDAFSMRLVNGDWFYVIE